MNNWISKIKSYLNKFLELGVLLLGVSVIAEILFGPNVAFFGSKVTNNLINLLNNCFCSNICLQKIFKIALKI